MHKTHAGQVAVVTGAARGIGQVLAQRFAERGATVVGVDLLDQTETAALVCRAEAKFLPVRADLAGFSIDKAQEWSFSFESVCRIRGPHVL
jgi:NAD(P)-dependent dehydrogenase (short-subunit alcohol dehydrogenase family)